ncbi:MAG: hypothetical protein QXL15_03940 [Candidatus Korarchaeota archaeon]
MLTSHIKDGRGISGAVQKKRSLDTPLGLAVMLFATGHLLITWKTCSRQSQVIVMPGKRKNSRASRNLKYENGDRSSRRECGNYSRYFLPRIIHISSIGKIHLEPVENGIPLGEIIYGF